MPNRKSCGPLSVEHKANMGAAIRARHAADPSYSEKLSAVHKGKPKSAEMRRRLSEAKTGKPLSEATKQKIRDAQRTRRVDEADAKQSGPFVAVIAPEKLETPKTTAFNTNVAKSKRQIRFGGYWMTAEQYAEMVKILEVAGNAQ